MSTTNRQNSLTLASTAGTAPALLGHGFADAWPKDKISAVVPCAPGSTIDSRPPHCARRVNLSYIIRRAWMSPGLLVR